jgi:hypothetical protein
MRHRIFIALVVAALCVPFVSAVPALGAATDLLPDLQMAPIYGLQLQDKNGRKRLRFGTIVFNVGQGNIEIRSRDRSGNTMRRLSQKVYRSDGSVRTLNKPEARSFWAGDGHYHWHIARFIIVSLRPLAGPDPDANTRYLRKIGFCLVDTVTNPEWSNADIGSPSYFGCGDHESRHVRIGITVGWGDVYSPETSFQSIDVSDVPAGAYRICATVNPRGTWTEMGENHTNNSYWMDMVLDPATAQLQVTNSGDTPCS